MTRVAHRWDELARFNSEKARGIVHTPELVERMRAEQEVFNREQTERYIAKGWKQDEDNPNLWRADRTVPPWPTVIRMVLRKLIDPRRWRG